MSQTLPKGLLPSPVSSSRSLPFNSVPSGVNGQSSPQYPASAGSAGFVIGQFVIIIDLVNVQMISCGVELGREDKSEAEICKVYSPGFS